MGPSVGPKNSDAVNIPNGAARSSTSNKSASTAPVCTRDEEPNAPARKRQTRRPAKLREQAAPMLATVNAPKEMKKVGCRPKISLTDAQSSGPMAKQTTKRDTPRRAVVAETWYSSTSCETPPVYADDASATDRVASERMTMKSHLLPRENCRGSNGSSARHCTKYGDSAEPDPSYECCRHSFVMGRRVNTRRQVRWFAMASSRRRVLLAEL